jgi:hypothetical protein
MRPDLAPDETLVQRLPLPLAQLYRRAHKAKTPLERYLTAFYLWEAALKLLASVAVVEYAEHPAPDPLLAERLQNLARPALGHWCEFVQLLVPALAASPGQAPLRVVAALQADAIARASLAEAVKQLPEPERWQDCVRQRYLSQEVEALLRRPRP